VSNQALLDRHQGITTRLTRARGALAEAKKAELDAKLHTRASLGQQGTDRMRDTEASLAAIDFTKDIIDLTAEIDGLCDERDHIRLLLAYGAT
jgi:hypothetical protein